MLVFVLFGSQLEVLVDLGVTLISPSFHRVPLDSDLDPNWNEQIPRGELDLFRFEVWSCLCWSEEGVVSGPLQMVRTLLGAKGIATRSVRTLLGAPGLTTRSRDATRTILPLSYTYR